MIAFSRHRGFRLESTAFFTTYSRYAGARSKCGTSWCVHALPCLLCSHCSLWLVADLSFCWFGSFVKLGRSMETLLDPCREIVQKRLSQRSGSSSAATRQKDRTLWISLRSTAQTMLIAFPSNPEFRNSLILFLGNPRGFKIRLVLGWERIDAPLPPLRARPKCNFNHSRQLSPFPAVRWHIISLQEASEYVVHELLTNRFHVTHHEGCAILFNKDTFYPNVVVESIYPP